LAPASTPLVVIESSDEASLKSLMARTRLVISAVGPYQLYGNELVKACRRIGRRLCRLAAASPHGCGT
jgi:short subunit dehydrogenase-like uncharacterized protein